MALFIYNNAKYVYVTIYVLFILVEFFEQAGNPLRGFSP